MWAELHHRMEFAGKSGSYTTQTRHCVVVQIHQAVSDSGAYSSMGGQDGGGLREEEEQIPAACGGLPATRLESMVSASASRMQWLFWVVTVEGTEAARCDRSRPEEDDWGSL